MDQLQLSRVIEQVSKEKQIDREVVIEAIESAMVQAAKDLAAKGEIMLAGPGGEDELIY